MTNESVKKYEAMAKFNLAEPTREWAVKNISELEKRFEKLKAVDTNGITPLVSVLPFYGDIREDIAKQIITKAQVLANAPKEFDGYFEVPKTID